MVPDGSEGIANRGDKMAIELFLDGVQKSTQEIRRFIDPDLEIALAAMRYGRWPPTLP